MQIDDSRAPNSQRFYGGKIHKGMEEPVWLEINWNILGKDQYKTEKIGKKERKIEHHIEIAKIKNKEGEGR